jgi:hypothetical protein
MKRASLRSARLKMIQFEIVQIMLEVSTEVTR